MMQQEKAKQLPLSAASRPVTFIYLSAVAIFILPVALAQEQDDQQNLARSNRTAPKSDETWPPTGRCLELSSCGARLNRTNVSLNETTSCYCDHKCQLYDDCCRDSQWAQSMAKRIGLGHEKIRERRSQFHCKQANNKIGDVSLRAKCRPEWIKQQEDPTLARFILSRCEYERGKPSSGSRTLDEQDAELDPIGMMMPITDMRSGETYANSYCLRCNTLIGDGEWLQILRERRLTYWSPLLECNYDQTSNNGTSLRDLLSSKQGQVLQYSRKLNKWTITTTQDKGGQRTNSSEEQRACSITPIQPVEAEHLIRRCKADLIRSCPSSSEGSQLDEEKLQQARHECKFGHQSIAYSSNGETVYHNPACALCNHEENYTCEQQKSSRVSEVETTTVANDEPSSITGSFSVLMDLYGSPQDEISADALESARQHQHLCPSHKVFDPFYLTCRCMICGLNRKYAEGRCVDKFKQAMVYTTDVCLVVSITSLALYLILYALSTFDLRSLALRLAQWESESEERMSNQPYSTGTRRKSTHGGCSHLYLRRGSNECSSASGSASGARQSKNLATRGVASLASSLLVAYLLFMLGHQTNANIGMEHQTIRIALAATTYFCFMLAFCWMFLLAYDIWRTIRLATCKLQLPSAGSQSARFVSYALLALLVSVLLVGIAVLFDQLPSSDSGICRQQPQQQHQHSSSNSSCASSDWHHFVHRYKPKFAHRPSSCWFSNRRALALFFGTPVTLIVMANLLFFLHSSYMIYSTSSKSHKLNASSMQAPKARIYAESQPKLVSLGKELAPAPALTNLMVGDNKENSLTLSSIVSVQTIQSHLSAENSTVSSVAPSPCEEQLSGQATLLPLDQVKVLLSSSIQLQQPPQPSNDLKQASLDEGLISKSTGSSLTEKHDSHLQSIQSMMSKIVKDYRVYCRLSTIVGLTWLMGLLASVVDTNDCLWYLFVFFNTLQGMFIFMAFGCKRSKLCNLELIFDYVKFWLLNRSFRWCRQAKN